ncbi:hypothetical protein VIRA109638_03605 [Vibrio rarus]
MKIMELPKSCGLIQWIATVAAIIGCLVGVFMIFVSIASFKWGIIPGIMAISSGVMIIAASIVGLGLIFCFLSIVEAQIDTRNMTLKMLNK